MAQELGGGVGPIVVMGGCWVCFCFLVTAGSGGGGWLANNGGWPMITREPSAKIDGGVG